MARTHFPLGSSKICSGSKRLGTLRLFAPLRVTLPLCATSKDNMASSTENNDSIRFTKSMASFRHSIRWSIGRFFAPPSTQFEKKTFMVPADASLRCRPDVQNPRPLKRRQFAADANLCAGGTCCGRDFGTFRANFTGFRAEFEENLPKVVDFRSASG